MRLLACSIFSSFLFCLPLSADLALSLSAQSAILINADTGAVLYRKNPHQKLYPASITKVATCAYILELKGDKLDEVLTAEQDSIGSVTEEAKARAKYKLPSHWLVTDCSHIGIKRGEKMRMEDLLYGMMVASADDASNVLAQGIAGTVPEFMRGLNAYMQKLGCKDTCFTNPHGLHHPDHVTTAYDMALVAKEALKNPTFRKIVSTVRCTRPKTNIQEATVLLQTNRLLRKGEFYYPKAIGVKTGWHSKAQNTFVAAARDGERTLIAVLMDVKERRDIFKEAAKLFEAAFGQPKMKKTYVRQGVQKFGYQPKGERISVPVTVENDFSISFYPAEEPKVRAFVDWNAVELPIEKGELLGKISFKEGERLLGELKLFAAESAHPPHRALWISSGVLIFALGGFFLLYRRMR